MDVVSGYTGDEDFIDNVYVHEVGKEGKLAGHRGRTDWSATGQVGQADCHASLSSLQRNSGVIYKIKVLLGTPLYCYMVYLVRFQGNLNSRC